jgi:hypothetical protein
MKEIVEVLKASGVFVRVERVGSDDIILDFKDGRVVRLNYELIDVMPNCCKYAEICWNCDEELIHGICPNGCMDEEEDEENAGSVE